MPENIDSKKIGNCFYPYKGVICFNPDNDDSPLPNEDKRPSIVGLAHEFGHAVNNEKRARKGLSKQEQAAYIGNGYPELRESAAEKKNENEKRPIDYENIVRAYYQLAPRGYDYAHGEGVTVLK